MTRFVSDAVGVRSKSGGGLTSKDMKKNMEKFLQTGKHPDVERAKMANTDRIHPLPIHDANRDFVFLELQIAGRPLGKLVIELFVDLMPVGAQHLR